MRSIFRLLGAALLAFAITGCATIKPMAYWGGDPAPADQAIYLMGVTLTNSVKAYYGPTIMYARVTSSDGKDMVLYQMDLKGQLNGDFGEGATRSLLRLPTTPGPKQLVVLTGTAKQFPIAGNFTIPVSVSLPATEPGVYYLGHMTATLRAKQSEDEFPAGPPFPLIDQSVTGIAGSTFDVQFDDRYDEDMKDFVANFPPIAQAQVQKLPLPSFDVAQAKAWWVENQ